jgi:hypothetical protein
MSRERKQCQGIFRGLVIGRENTNGGLYSAVANGECKVIEYVEHSDLPELLKLEEEVIEAFIQADRLPLS